MEYPSDTLEAIGMCVRVSVHVCVCLHGWVCVCLYGVSVRVCVCVHDERGCGGQWPVLCDT